MPSTPLAVLAGLDTAALDVVGAAVACDRPGTAVIRHALDADAGTLRRVVSDLTGVLEDVVLPIEHACLTCALREDVLPTLARLSRSRPGLVLALPVAADPRPVVAALESARPRPPVRVTSVLAVTDQAVEDALLGPDLLVERGLALGAADRRGVGEAHARQVEYADVVVGVPEADRRGRTLLAHLTRPGAVHFEAAHEVSAVLAFDGDHDAHLAARHVDPVHRRPPAAVDADGVRTLDLSTWRPLHPDRLLAAAEVLAAGAVRTRGRLWLPTRPDRVVEWDGAGGQLSIGDAGPWPTGARRTTRLLVTGVLDDEGPRRDAFASAQLTDSELAGGLAVWSGRDDGLDDWLGSAPGAA